MASRYWVGNLGNWNDTAHWSATSGGAGGASVPGKDDDVFIDANSFTKAGQYIQFPTVIEGEDTALIVPDVPAIAVELSKIEETPVSFDTELSIPDVPSIGVVAKIFTSVGTCTITVASPCVVTKSSHGLSDEQEICFTTTGTLPNEIIKGRSYYVKYIDANTFNLSVVPGGSVMDTTGSSSGTHTLWKIA